MKLLRFEWHKMMFFCLLWKGPIFEPKKSCITNGLNVEKCNVFRFCCPKVEFYAFSWNQLVGINIPKVIFRLMYRNHFNSVPEGLHDLDIPKCRHG